MSRLHIHLSVNDIQSNIDFYTALFGVAPTVVKPDYAKWMLDDPKVNFAISNRGRELGLDHVGIQAEDEEELAALERRLNEAGIQGMAQRDTTCCYARSNKYWTVDPQRIPWETFHTLSSAPTYFEENAEEKTANAGQSCCAPRSNCC